MLACYNGCGYSETYDAGLKLRKVGNSVGVVLPKEALARMNVEEGDAVFLTETTDGDSGSRGRILILRRR